jgi:hypothetical protein
MLSCLIKNNDNISKCINASNIIGDLTIKNVNDLIDFYNKKHKNNYSHIKIIDKNIEKLIMKLFDELYDDEKITYFMKIFKNNYNSTCSATGNHNNYSCIKTNLLEEIIKNNNYADINDIKKKTEDEDEYRKKLVEIINVKSHSKSELEWNKHNVYDKLDKKIKRLIDNCYKPSGPIDKEWLNNLEIENFFERFEDNRGDFYFIGVFPRDFANFNNNKINHIDENYLNKINIEKEKINEENKKQNLDMVNIEPITKLGTVFNHDKTGQQGSHWVALFIKIHRKDGKPFDINAYYFDSVGNPPKKEYKDYVQSLFNKFNIKYDESKFKINKIQHQTYGGDCGVYAITFIVRMMDGEDFDELCKNIIPPDEMNLIRKLIFKDKDIYDDIS